MANLRNLHNHLNPDSNPNPRIKIHEYIKKMVTTDYVLTKCLKQRKKSESRNHHGRTGPPVARTPSRQRMADIKKSYQWLDKAGQKDNNEIIIMAEQQAALDIRSIEAAHPSCRLCKCAPTTG